MIRRSNNVRIPCRCSGPEGRLIRLPVYSKDATSILLGQTGTSKLKPNRFSRIPITMGPHRLSPRFAIRVFKAAGPSTSGGTPQTKHLWQRRWRPLSAGSVPGDVRKDGDYICSWPLLSLWIFSIAIGWFFEPVVGWLSFLPLFVGFPFSFYFAPPVIEIAPNDSLDRRISTGNETTFAEDG